MKDSLGIMLMKWRNRVVLPFLQGDVLDVGCGTNTLIREYRRSRPNSRAMGVDVYPWDGVDLCIEDAGKLPFEVESFDTIVCVAAFNHIPNRRDFLNEAKRILKPNGKLIITMIPPGISAVWHRLHSPWDADQHERGMVDGEVYGFTEAQIRNEFAVARFSVIATRRFMLGINCLYVAAVAPPESSLSE